ncbi:hypothetical protein [Bacillus sp. REN3]|uniref:hypothetical protein n=1 Tax=Bacillus sp. REN3 TaxID=2802440 RepID=UPI001AEE41BE|nr:hypothetical protein [Bacillus sp. REN3]
MKYKLWLYSSILLSLFLVFFFYPNPYEDMFPLFNDLLTILIFMPSVFVLISSLASLFDDLVRNHKLWIILPLCFLSVGGLGWKMLGIFHPLTIVLVLIFGIFIGVTHFGISKVLKQNLSSKF